MTEEINIKDLQKQGFKVDFLPKGLKIGLIFQMNSLLFLHIGNKKVVLVMFEDEKMELPYA